MEELKNEIVLQQLSDFRGLRLKNAVNRLMIPQIVLLLIEVLAERPLLKVIAAKNTT